MPWMRLDGAGAGNEIPGTDYAAGFFLRKPPSVSTSAIMIVSPHTRSRPLTAGGSGPFGAGNLWCEMLAATLGCSI